jgi:hypothetical protein
MSDLSGEEGEQEVTKAIRSSDFFLACLSRNSVNSQGRTERKLNKQLRVLWSGIDNETFLIPVRLEDHIIPESLLGFEHVDLFHDDGMQTLFRAITKVADGRRNLDKAFAHLSAEEDLPATQITKQQADDSATEVEESSLEGPVDPTSAFDWGIDLRKLVNGEREDALEHLGGIEDYIEVMLAEADDISLAEQAFNTALEKLVQTWQPTAVESEEQASNILELIRSYTPPPGFVKVIEYIHWLNQFAATRDIEAVRRRDEDLHLKALVALEGYYGTAPQPPEDESAAYRTYIDILKEDFESPVRCGYALRRLLELKVAEFGEDVVNAIIYKNPTALKELVSMLLDPNRKSMLEQSLAFIYIICLEAGDEAEVEFGQAVIFCGGHIERIRNKGPVIHIQGRIITITLRDHLLHKYLLLTLRREAAAGRDKLESLSAHV